MLPARYQPLSGSAIPGGFGSVQQVRDTYLDRVVLFKSMQDKANNDQLLSEIQGLSKARSRHVVEIYDVIKSNDGAVIGIIIEYLTGPSYTDFYKRNNPTALDYIKALYQISCALRDLHVAGITHRDLKLDNIKNSGSGLLKLFDFGLSVAGEYYRTRLNRGTFVYAAPEFYVRDAEITKKMDVYALGVCAWALATNTFPAELLERPPQQSARAPSIDTVLPGLLHQEIVQMIDACLDPTPTARPTAEEFSALFAKHLTRDKHKGLFTQGRQAVYELSTATPNVTITINPLGSLRTTYDGLAFRIVGISGTVYVNNDPAVVGATLHESCVLTFGPPALGPRREWVTFSASQPEVVL